VPLRVMAMTARAETAYRSELSMRVARLLIGLGLLWVLWHAVFAGRPDAAREAYAFCVYGGLVQFFSVRIPDRLGDRVRDGSVVYIFSRPMRPMAFYLWQDAGRVLVAGAGLTVLLALAAAVHAVPPASAARLALLFPASVVAMTVAALIVQLVELSSIWLLDNRGVRTLVPAIVALLSGAVVPLPLCPSWFRAVAAVLPFAATVDLPVRLYLDPGRAAVFLGQLGWLAALLVLTRLVWWRAALRVRVLGG
jgi:ABC-2 type transport system permease protein